MSSGRWLCGSVLLTLSVGCASSLGPSTHLTSAGVETSQLRREHADLSRRLNEASELADALDRATVPSTQSALMHRLVVFFTAEIGEHTRWEQGDVYALVDRAVAGAKPFTQSLRSEHELMSRWTSELTAIASAEAPDVRAFVHLARDLLGLARGHAATEDAVVLPLLDQLSSPR